MAGEKEAVVQGGGNNPQNNQQGNNQQRNNPPGGGGGGNKPGAQGGGKPGVVKQSPLLYIALTALSAVTTVITLYVLLQGRIALGTCSLMVEGCVQRVWVSFATIVVLGVALQVLFGELAKLRNELWRIVGEWVDIFTIVIAVSWLLIATGISPEFKNILQYIRDTDIGLPTAVWSGLVLAVAAVLHNAGKVAGSR